MKFNDRARFTDEEFARLWARVSDINRSFDEQRKRQDDERKRWWEETLRRHEQQRGSTGRHIIDPVLIGPVLVATTVAIAVNLLINVLINHWPEIIKAYH